MSRSNLVVCMLVLAAFVASPCPAADPPVFLNPFKGLTRSPFSAELEVYSGGITGDSIGSAYRSATRGDYGLRFTFGFLKALNFNLNYMYTNQSRSFAAVTPASGTLPAGTLLMRAANLNVAFGSGEFTLLQSKQAKFYISPGIGFARNGARSMTLITPLGGASTPILPGTAVTFNLGAGVKVYPLKRLGFRFDVRDHVSGGGTGNLNVPSTACAALVPPPPTCLVRAAQPYFGRIPVQNNLVFTLGLIFKIL